MTRLRRFTGLVVGAIVLGHLYLTGSLRPSPEAALEPRPPRAIREAAPFRFREQSAALGLNFEHHLYYPNPQSGSYLPLMALPPSVAVADIDDDGYYDLYVTQPDPRLPNKLFHNLQGRGFEEIASQVGLDKHASDPDSVALFIDLDHDGLVDLVQSRFGCLFGSPERFDADKRVSLAAGSPFGHAQAVGISDIDKNGFPDIYVASDYSYDALYMNGDGRTFTDGTEAWTPRREHGFSGMNVDFADFDNTGELGIFVLQMHIPPFVQTGNLLWKREGDRFRNVAAERGVKKCGWAWTGKFADFDNSGSLDLFVVNGKARGSRATSPRDGYKSFAFVRNTISTLPLQLRWDIGLYPPFDSFTMSGFQPSCFFWNHDGHFSDVAHEVGIDDLEEGQAAALIDFDNDGRTDIVVGNMGKRLLFYHNLTPNPGHFVGVLPVWGAHPQPAYGARLTLYRSDGKTPLRELFPANGYRGQSDPRVHFGLGAATEVPRLEVTWPDGTREIFEHLAVDRYQPIVFGTGRAP